MTGSRTRLRDRGADRGQVVLVSAAVVAVALLAMTAAYAQLGYAADRSTAADVDVASLSGIDRSLTASFRAAAADVIGGGGSIGNGDASGAGDAAPRWRDRRGVADAVRTAIEADAGRLERAHAAEGRSLTVTFDDGAATRWARERCPGGMGRAFGPCRAIDGIVVQERAGTATPVAAALRVRIVSPVESTRATLVVRS